MGNVLDLGIKRILRTGTVLITAAVLARSGEPKNYHWCGRKLGSAVVWIQFGDTGKSSLILHTYEGKTYHLRRRQSVKNGGIEYRTDDDVVKVTWRTRPITYSVWDLVEFCNAQ